MIANQYKTQIPMNYLCKWLSIPRSVYYYHPSNNRKGISPSQITFKRDGTMVSNTIVVDEIKKILSDDFVCYGYQNVTAVLKNMNFIINHKKVYRLMDESNLLLGKIIKTQGKREWVKFRKISASKPMEYLCWDIKYIWVPGERKNYYLLSLMDVYSRRIIDWILQSSIRKIDMLKMINRVHLTHDLKGVTVRNDNGSQFIANKVRHYLRTLEANQEFTHIATPEENSYIEAFHSILEREVIKRFDFTSFYDTKLTLTAYMHFYNTKRLHGSLKRITPMQKWNEYYFPLSSDKPLSAQVSENMSRVSACADTGLALDIFEDTATFANRMINENKGEARMNNLHYLNKSVQVIGG